MNRRLYVGNLAYSLNEGQINDFFNQVGVVLTIKLVTDRDSGHAKGFGFVEMSTDEEAQKAIKELNGRTLAERQIVIRQAAMTEKRKSNDGYSSFLSRALEQSKRY
jgi:RNA recognition motif-containing protein